MVKTLGLFATLEITTSVDSSTKTITYSSTGESLLNEKDITNCVTGMINPDTFKINSQQLIPCFEGNCSAEKYISCDLIQNYQLLLNEIPVELQNLYYGVYPNNQPLYNDVRFIYNKLLNYFPHAIYYPEVKKQISYLIKNFINYKLEFAIRCGGHAYEPASLSSGYIIDVKKLPQYVNINKDRKTAKFSSGLKLGYVIEKLAEHSLITPTGEHACVGISGLSLAGGKGNLTRIYGLTCDNIVSVKMINAQGEIVKANATENKDLLWACKGAGCGNFGVITEIELKVYEDIYCQIETLKWDWNTKHVKEIYSIYQEWILNLPKTISAEFNMTYNNKVASFSVKFIKFGEGDFIENNIFKNLHNPTITVCKGYYSKILDCWVNYDLGLNPPFSKIKSSMIFKPINDEAIDLLVNSINFYVKKGYEFQYQLNFTQLGGEVVEGRSSYFPKSAIMVLSYFMQWTYPELTDELKSFLKKLYNKVVLFVSIYCFPNLIDYDLTDYMEKYYGSNKNRLLKIKQKYDPTNVFKYMQSIR